jgi:hypothetical protein
VGDVRGSSCDSKSSHKQQPLPASRAKRLPNDGHHCPYQRLVVFSSSADKPLWFSDVALARKPFQPLSNGTPPLHADPTPQVPSPQYHGGASSSSLLQAPPHSPLLGRDPLDIILSGRREEPRIELVAGNRRFQVCLRASLLSIPSSSVLSTRLLNATSASSRATHLLAPPRLFAASCYPGCCVLGPFFPLHSR